MWMMGYNDAGDFSMPDSFAGRKLRPAVVPRQITMPFAGSPTSAPPCLGRINGADFFALNHHLANDVSEQSKREMSIHQVVVSSRWNPTPEQLRVLEDLYQRGTRTPSPEQIQNITTQLRRYGKIEGKNVFYWFQNHKARERQKKRRQMELSPPKQQNNGELQALEIRKESSSGGATNTLVEEEQIKDQATTIDYTTLFQKSEKASTVAEGTTREAGWLQLKETELGLPYRKNYLESSRNATRHMMQMSMSCPPSQHEPPRPTPHITNKTMDQSLIKTISPRRVPYRCHYETTNNISSHLINVSAINSTNHGFIDCGYCYDGDGNDNKTTDNLNGNDFQTLQLFPLRSSDDSEGNGSHGMHLHAAEEKEMEISLPAFNYDNYLITSPDNVVVPTHHHFFEFLPLKN